MLHKTFSSFRPSTCGSFRPLNLATFFSRYLSSKQRRIRLMILSDTHGYDCLKDISLIKADVVLHCGDLTNDSQAAELGRTLAMLRSIDAPLKLAIPGNHDFSLESGYWRRMRAQVYSHSPQQQQVDDDGGFVPAQIREAENQEDNADIKASWELLRDAAQRDNIFLLPQGTHTFTVPSDDAGSGARLRLFASPLTPRGGNWGFQYDRSNPHKWTIPPMITPNGDWAVDVVMTHGPPRGIRDGTGVFAGQGCAALLAAVERSRPLVHCFGHIHGAWGAEMIAWKREMVSSATLCGPSAPTFGNLIDAQRSRVLESLQPASKAIMSGEKSGLGPPPPVRVTRRHHSPPRKEGGCCAVNIAPGGEHALEQGSQTLFVNAAMGSWSGGPARMPWLIDMVLPVVGEEDAAAVAETMSRLSL